MEEQNWQAKTKAVRKNAPPRRTGIIGSPGNTRHTFPAILQFCNRSGLCNRLRGWAGIGAITDLYNLTFMVHWQRNPVCQCDFNSVFVPDSCGVMTSQRDRGKYNLLAQFTGTQATHNTEVYMGMMGIPDDVFWKAAKKRALALKLQPEWQDKLETYMETVPDNAIGLHVRRTDLIGAHIADPPLCEELDQIVADDPDATFLLCADNPHSVAMLKERYGDRIFWREQGMAMKKKRRHRNTSQANAAVDLYALARTTRIIGTRCSSFSGYAAFLGGLDLKPV